MCRRQAINGYFTCARGRLLTRFRDATSCTHGSPRGRDGAHRHVRSRRAPTVTEGWYKEFIRRVMPRGRNVFERLQPDALVAKIRRAPDASRQCAGYGDVKSGETPRGGRRAFLKASRARPWARCPRPQSRSGQQRAQFAAAAHILSRSCVAQFAANAHKHDASRQSAAASGQPAATDGSEAQENRAPARLAALEDVFRMCPRGPSMATQRRTGRPQGNSPRHRSCSSVLVKTQ